MNINLIITPLRPTQTAVIHANDDGTYTILVNSHKSELAQREGVLHELSHIRHNDFSSEVHANLLEKITHNRILEEELETINFYYHVI